MEPSIDVGGTAESGTDGTEGALEDERLGGLEAIAEARETVIGKNGLSEQVDTIKSRTLGALEAHNEALEERVTELSQIETNRIAGDKREQVVGEELRREYPTEDGFQMERECYLRDKEGDIVRDPHTGESRRIDFVIVKDGKITRSVEVTSETAPKRAQMEKEARIRQAGGNYVKVRGAGELARFGSERRWVVFWVGVRTEIRRRA